MSDHSYPKSSLSSALDHGRDALYFHSGERGRMFRVFLLILTAAMAGVMFSTTGAHSGVALSIAVLMGVISMLFKLLDYRSRKLVHHAEKLLHTAEIQLAEETGLQDCLLIARSEEQRDMSHTILFQASYTIVIILSVFVAIFTYGDLGS